MTPELTILTLAALLQMLQMGLFSVLAQKQVGPRYAASPRDERDGGRHERRRLPCTNTSCGWAGSVSTTR